MEIKVIDLSSHNTILDWDALNKTTNTIAIRLGYRDPKSGTLLLDSKFLIHLREAMNKNMHIGIIFEDQSLNELEAIEAANFVSDQLNLYLSEYEIELPVFLLSQAYRNNIGRADEISKEQRTSNIISFCNRIEELGFIPGIYAGENWIRDKMIYDNICDYDIWVTKFHTAKPIFHKYVAWQSEAQNFFWARDAVLNISTFYKNYSTQTNKKSYMFKAIMKDRFEASVSESGLQVYKLPNKLSEKVHVLSKNFKVKIYDFTKEGWVKISIEDEWVHSSYLKPLLYGTVINEHLNIYNNDNNDATIIRVLKPKEIVKIFGMTEHGWYLTQYGYCTSNESIIKLS